MCGIVGFTGERDAAPVLLKVLKKLNYRGYDSSGMSVAGYKDKVIQTIKALGVVTELENKTK